MPADHDLVKVSLKFKPADDLPASEGLWARPVEAHEGGGIYELENSSFMVPLAAGDRVRAQLDGDSRLQIVDLAGASSSLLTVIQAHCEGSALQAMLDRWASAGALWTEGGNGVMITTWRPGLSPDDIGVVLRPDLLSGRGEWVATAAPDDRTRAALHEVDFDLDTEQHFPPIETAYWAADDPYWASVGLANPDFLAYVQRLASEDERVANALERGQQDRVLLYIERISAPDPRDLPPLDGPIFDED